MSERDFEVEEDDLPPLGEVEPVTLVSEIAQGLRPVVLGTGVVLAGLLASAGLLVASLGGQSSLVAGVAAQAATIDAEKEWAMPEFAPTEVLGADVSLGVFLVNPLDAAKVRYVRCAISLTVSDIEEFEATGVAQTRARAAIVGLLGSRTVEELGRPGGPDEAREQIRRVIRSHFSDDLVLAVHFSEFVVQ